jgi:hypothetical protein
MYRLLLALVLMSMSGLENDMAAASVTPPIIGTGTGLSGQYYDSLDADTVAVTRIDPVVDFVWSTVSPSPQVAQTTFAVVWKGTVQAQFSETYTISTLSDDGVLVWIGDRLVINNWTDHGATTNSATIDLIAGIQYQITVRYYQNLGSAVMKLMWASPSTPIAVIPQTQLYPDITPPVPRILSITSPIESRTSPAWVEGTLADANSPVHAVVNGVPYTVETEGGTRWYVAGKGTVRTEFGIDLDPADPVAVALSNGSPSNSLTQTVAWTVTDLANLPYGMVQMDVRTNDSLLVTSSATGKHLVLTVSSNGGQPNVVSQADSAPGRTTIIRFDHAGIYDVAASIDGKSAGSLRVTAISVDLKGPIACEIGYQRIKDVAATPTGILGTTSVMFTSSDPDDLIVTSHLTPTGERLALLPAFRSRGSLQARLHDSQGPLLSSQPIDEFTITSNATQGVQFIKTMPDGSTMAKAMLTMTPLISDLDVVLRGLIAGITFEDSTTIKHVNSNAFTRSALWGTYPYYLIRGPGKTGHYCHTIIVYQQGVQVSF